MNILSKWQVRLAIGFIAGAIIVYVDNFAFQGEVSPIVIVVMLLAVAATAGTIWGWRGWNTVIATWACVPTAHLVKHVLGLPDTLNPNTYTSILMLAIFTFVISTVGIGSGVLLGRLTKFGTKRNS
jgi:hypothetical protein